MTTPAAPQPPLDSLRTETWLYRKGPGDNPQLFVERYYDLIKQFADRVVRRYGGTIDFMDAAHEVIARLLSLEAWSFQRDRGRFRAFLYQVVHNAVRQQLRERQRRARRGDCGVGGDKDFFEAIPDANCDALADRIGAQLQEDAQRVLKAFERARERVGAATAEAFILLKVSGLAGEEVARRLNMPTRAVYDAGYRFLKRVKKELAGTELDRGTLERLLEVVLPQLFAPTAAVT